ncbi:MAG: hypothetical protein U9R34_06365 [Nanoarchaeota archaeon]|nr:hypothetical protein [Nanoarchaeota archaeon]
MKELITKLKRIDTIDEGSILLDTCFFISCFKHPKNIRVLESMANLCMTSFNIGELLHAEHHLKHELKIRIRKFFHKADNLCILDINVKPGEWDNERSFVADVDSELLKHVHDPSDAVLIAAAIKFKSQVMTKDKHHLYTSDLANFLHRYGVRIEKDFYKD